MLLTVYEIHLTCHRGRMNSRMRTIVLLSPRCPLWDWCSVEGTFSTADENWVLVAQLVTSHCSAWATLTHFHIQFHYGYRRMEHLLMVPVPHPLHKIAVSILVRLFSKEQTSVFSFRHIEARLMFVYTNSCFASRCHPFIFRRVWWSA
jgi:hypothetical protein